MDLRTKEVFDIPFPPIDLGERPNSPSFTGDSIVGRTSQPVTYTYSDNRTIGASMTILDDYVEKPLTEVRDILASMSMPMYKHGQIIQPTIQAKFGALVIRGVLTSINFQWSGIFRNGYYTTLLVTFEIKEAREIPLGSSEVRAGGWNNG